MKLKTREDIEVATSELIDILQHAVKTATPVKNRPKQVKYLPSHINPLNPELNPICYLLALLGAHHFLHVSRIRVKLLTLRRIMSYIWSTHF